MLGPFLFFGASSAVMLYLVIVFNRLPNDEFARRIESAGTGRVLSTLAQASPGVGGKLGLMTAASGLRHVAEPSVSNWERAALLVVGIACLACGVLSVSAAFLGVPRYLLFRQARDPKVRRAAAD